MFLSLLSNSQTSLMDYNMIHKTDVIEILLCMPKLADVLDKKTTHAAIWASNNCTIYDTIREENYNMQRYKIHFEFPFNFNLALLIINLLRRFSFMRSEACD